jgi:ATP-dependent Lon protease
LRGKVLPIGGVKEKSLAARRAGLDTVILPLQNQGDVRELSDELRGDLKFIFAETIGDVLSAALEGRLVGKA